MDLCCCSLHNLIVSNPQHNSPDSKAGVTFIPALIPFLFNFLFKFY
ncbi:hypothetical protein X975_13154, partial [Stegodyphus mimosarum]